MCTKVIPCGFNLPHTDCSFCIMGRTMDGSGSSFLYDISFNWASFDCSFVDAGQSGGFGCQNKYSNDSVAIIDNVTSGTGNTLTS